MKSHAFMTLIAVSAVAVSLAAVPASNPASPPDAPELTELEQNLLMQLSDAEANIQATNKALVRTGYNVGLAYNQIDSNLKGNEYMNRNGGGPVRWDAFYGKTARDFVMHDAGSPVYHQVKRPSQFNHIYKANDDQVARAKEQIAALAQDQATLLARRQKHEADQSRLWATLAWEQVKDREIDFHPLCRFVLRPAGPQAAVLRPVIRFLRTADRVAIDGIDLIAEDQGATFKVGSQRLEVAFAGVQESLADVLDDPNLTADQRKEGQTLKALCKDLAEKCEVITENYANALDRDQAKQDTSKLQFRGQLQSSLGEFAVAVGHLDDEVSSNAKAWGIEADRSRPTPDTVAPAPGPRREAPIARESSKAAAALPAKISGGRINLLGMVDASKDAVHGAWKMQNGALISEATPGARVEFPYTPPEEYDFRVVFVKSRGHGAMEQICYAAGHQFCWVVGGWHNQKCAFESIDLKNDVQSPAQQTAAHWLTDGQRYVSIVKVRKRSIEGYLNDKLIVRWETNYNDMSLMPIFRLSRGDTVGVLSFADVMTFESAEIIEVTGKGKQLR